MNAASVTTTDLGMEGRRSFLEDGQMTALCAHRTAGVDVKRTPIAISPRRLERKDSLSSPGFERLRQQRPTLRGLLNREYCDAIVVEPQGKVEPGTCPHQVEIACGNLIALG